MHLGPLGEDEYLWDQELAGVIDPADLAALDRPRPADPGGLASIALLAFPALLLATVGCLVGWWLP